MIAARALQGVGAAVASPTAFALVATTFAAGPARNQAIAIFAAMTGVGSIAGLIIGGALTEVSWRLIFLINVPIGIALVGMAFRALRETNQTRLALDVPGAILATLGCTGVVFALTEGPEMGWGSIAVIGALAAGLVALAAFLFVERTADNPLLPFSLFADRNRVATFLAIFFVGGAMFSMTAFVALFVQDIMQYSPLRAGIAFIPFAFGLGAAASVASKLAVKVQPRWLVLTGVVIMIVGLLYGSTLDSDSTYLANLFVPVIGIGFGIGSRWCPCTVRDRRCPGDRDRPADRNLPSCPDARWTIGAVGDRCNGDVQDALARRHFGQGSGHESGAIDRTRRGVHLRTCGLRGLRRVRRYRGAVHQVHTFSGSPGSGCGEGSSGNRLISPVFPLR